MHFGGVLGEDWQEVIRILHHCRSDVQHWEMLASLRHIQVHGGIGAVVEDGGEVGGESSSCSDRAVKARGRKMQSQHYCIMLYFQGRLCCKLCPFD